MTLHLPQKTYGKPLYYAVTGYKRNQAIRVYIGSQVKRAPKKTKKTKQYKGMSAGASTIQVPFIKKPLVVKHHFLTKETYGAAELKATISSLQLIVDTLPLFPKELQHRPIIFYSSSKYILDGITKYLPKWEANNWKSLGYTREQEKQRRLQEEYIQRWPHQKDLVEAYYRNPLEGIIANLDLWKEIKLLLDQLETLKNKVYFRKVNKPIHFKLKKKACLAALRGIDEASLTITWTQHKKSYRNMTLEERDLQEEEDKLFIKYGYLLQIERYFTRYYKYHRKEPSKFLGIQETLEYEGSSPSTMTIQAEESNRPSVTSIGYSNHLTAPGVVLEHTSIGRQTLPVLLTSLLDNREESAGSPFKASCNPTTLMSLSMPDVFINKLQDDTSIGNDDPSVEDYMVPIGNKNDRSVDPASIGCIYRDVESSLPSSPSHLVAVSNGISLTTSRSHMRSRER